MRLGGYAPLRELPLLSSADDILHVLVTNYVREYDFSFSSHVQILSKSSSVEQVTALSKLNNNFAFFSFTDYNIFLTINLIIILTMNE